MAVTVLSVSPSRVIQRFAANRRSAQSMARVVLEDREELHQLLIRFEDCGDSRFESLCAMLRSLGADAILMMSQINTMEIAGLPSTDFAVVVPADGSVLYILTGNPEEVEQGASYVGKFSSLVEAVNSLSLGSSLAVEEAWITLGLANALEAVGFALVSSSAALSKWRERRDLEDFASTAIVAQASRYAIDGAIEYAQSSLRRHESITELHIHQRYLELVADFEHGLNGRIRLSPFFANCHAADRTLYPSLPTDFPVSVRSNTLKLDAGLKLSIDGVVMATSDLARTLTTVPEASESYMLFLGMVRRMIRDELRIGRPMKQIHQACVGEILGSRDTLLALGMMSPSLDFAGLYGMRNVGHLMGKQESFVTEFRPGNSDTLRRGDIGALEIQWPFAPYAIGAEDMWFLTDSGGVAISS